MGRSGDRRPGDVPAVRRNCPAAWLRTAGLACLAFILLLLLALPQQAASAQTALESAQEPFAIVDVSVVPMDSERIVPGQTVLVENGRIALVGPTASTRLPAGTLQIDGSSLFLIPGLADMNINLAGYDSPSALTLLLANGVTTARNFGGQPKYLEWREQVKRGEIDGPSLITSGPVVAPASVLGWMADVTRPLIFLMGAGLVFLLGWLVLKTAKGRLALPRPTRTSLGVVGLVAVIVSGYAAFFVVGFPDLAGRSVALVDSTREAENSPPAQRQAGYDFTALAADLTPALYEALLSGSSADPVRPAGEIPWFVGPQDALRRDAQDLSRLDQLLPLLQRGFDPARPYASYPLDTSAAASAVGLAADSRATFCSALFLLDQIAAQAKDPSTVLGRSEAKHLPGNVLRTWEPDQNVYFSRYKGRAEVVEQYSAALRSLVPQLRDAGVRLIAGSSAGAPGIVWGFDLHSELDTLVDAGLSPYEALVAATRSAADSVGQSGEWGVIAPGTRADLVLVGSNPLDDIRATRDIRAVMAAGRWYARSDLDRLLASATPSAP